MLNEYEIPAFIGTKLPEIECDLKDLYLPKNIHDSIQVLTDYTKKKALANDLKKVEKCLALAEKMYQKGNAEVKRSVVNIFVLSFPCLKLACSAEEWRKLLSFIPSTLFGLYLRQVQIQERAQ